MSLDLAPPHADLTFMTALSEDHADRLVRFASAGSTGTVADLGCGWAELLLRVLQAAPDARGVGVDTDDDAVRHGNQLASERGLGDRVRLTVGDARTVDGIRPDVAICIGASQIWGAPVEDDGPLDYRAALAALREMLPTGGRLVYGEAIWSRPPTAAATQPLAGRPDEFITLPEVLDIAIEERFRPVQVFEATVDEWDVFESGYSACYARWLAEHPADHPDAVQVRELADRQRQAYFRGYRGILGMAYFGLLAV